MVEAFRTFELAKFPSSKSADQENPEVPTSKEALERALCAWEVDWWCRGVAQPAHRSPIGRTNKGQQYFLKRAVIIWQRIVLGHGPYGPGIATYASLCRAMAGTLGQSLYVPDETLPSNNNYNNNDNAL